MKPRFIAALLVLVLILPVLNGCKAAASSGEKTVTEAIVESILSKQIDDLEPILTRHGYNVKSLSEQFNAQPAEIRSSGDISENLNPLSSKLLGDILFGRQPDKWQRIFRGFGRFFLNFPSLFNHLTDSRSPIFRFFS